MNKLSKYVIFLLLILSQSFSCKGPIQIDYEIVPGIVFGREKWSVNDASNAWLISLQPLNSKTYGSNLTYGGKLYTNVVKTFKLDQQYQDSTKVFAYSFYLRDDIPQPVCDLTGGAPASIPQIKIVAVNVKG